MPPQGSEIFHRRERLFYSVFPFASDEKTDEGREFTIAVGTVKVCLLHLRLKDLRKCVTDRIYLNAFSGFNDGDS